MKEKVIHEFYTHYSSWHTVHIFTNPRLHHPERERLEAEKAAEAEKRKTEEESSAQRKPDALQPQKLEIDFETLVIFGIAAEMIRSRKIRTNPRSNPRR